MLPIKHCRIFVFFLLLIFSANHGKSQQYFLYAGTYTHGKGEGIYVFRFDGASGKLLPVDTTRGIDNPSFLTISNDRKFLYAVNENGGNNPGYISAFYIDRANGKLKLLNQKPSFGDYPCYITVSDKRKWIIVANYGGGSLVAYALQPDGSLSVRYQLIRHQGSGLLKARQEKPHVHATVFSPGQQYLLATDLGIDQVKLYQFTEDSSSTPLAIHLADSVLVPPGSGPRHLTFHPNKQWAYLAEELSGMVSCWNYKKGSLKNFQRLDAYPPHYTGSRGSADIHISPDGNYLYVSNRFEANNLAIFRINPKTGMLSLIGFQDVLGKKPRNFTIDPKGKFVLVANQDSDDIRVFSRDANTGLLKATGNVIKIANPVCLQLVPAP